MQNARLTLHLEPEEGHYVPLDTFVGALTHFRRMLRGLGTSVPGQRQGLTWLVTDLQIGSALAAVDPVGDAETGLTKSTIAMQGLDALEHEQPPAPSFPIESMEAARDLADLGEKAKIRTFIRGLDRRLQVTGKTAMTANRLLVVAVWEDLGTVEGSLEMVTVHERYQCNIYESITGRRVECYFKAEDLDIIKAGLGRRVQARGLVRYTGRGDILSVRADHIDILPEEHQLPSIGDVVGLVHDISEGLTTEQHIRRLRDE